MTPPAAPRVIDLAWGAIETDAGTFRDAKIWPGGGRNWDWNETGTSHRPGVQVSDAEELLDHGVEALVIGCGQLSRLGVTEELRSHLEAEGVSLVVEETSAAIETYHDLAARGGRVGALLHSTC